MRAGRRNGDDLLLVQDFRHRQSAGGAERPDDRHVTAVGDDLVADADRFLCIVLISEIVHRHLRAALGVVFRNRFIDTALELQSVLRAVARHGADQRELHFGGFIRFGRIGLGGGSGFAGLGFVGGTAARGKHAADHHEHQQKAHQFFHVFFLFPS